MTDYIIGTTKKNRLILHLLKSKNQNQNKTNGRNMGVKKQENIHHYQLKNLAVDY